MSHIKSLFFFAFLGLFATGCYKAESKTEGDRESDSADTETRDSSDTSETETEWGCGCWDIDVALLSQADREAIWEHLEESKYQCQESGEPDDLVLTCNEGQRYKTESACLESLSVFEKEMKGNGIQIKSAQCVCTCDG